MGNGKDEDRSSQTGNSNDRHLDGDDIRRIRAAHEPSTDSNPYARSGFTLAPQPKTKPSNKPDSLDRSCSWRIAKTNTDRIS